MSTATKQESCFGHQFADPRLLDQALTHRSAASHHNERLEFLGDAVLNYLIAEELFRRSPQSAEGDLSRLRAWLVRGSTLADIGAETGLGSSIALGSGERRSGGQRRRSILADTVEAVLGAILLDGGIEAVRQVVQQLFRTRLESLPDAEALFSFIAQDKKVSRGALTFILTRGIGQSFIAKDVPASEVMAFLKDNHPG